MMRDTIHRVAGALSEGRPDAVVRAIQNSFLVRLRPSFAQGTLFRPLSPWHWEQSTNTSPHHLQCQAWL